VKVSRFDKIIGAGGGGHHSFGIYRESFAAAVPTNDVHQNVLV
jgi:hypothetical protein